MGEKKRRQNFELGKIWYLNLTPLSSITPGFLGLRPFIKDPPDTLHSHFLMYAIILLPNYSISFISIFSFLHSSAWHLFLPTLYNSIPHSLWSSWKPQGKTISWLGFTLLTHTTGHSCFLNQACLLPQGQRESWDRELIAISGTASTLHLSCDYWVYLDKNPTQYQSSSCPHWAISWILGLSVSTLLFPILWSGSSIFVG